VIRVGERERYREREREREGERNGAFWSENFRQWRGKDTMVWWVRFLTW